MIQKQIVYLPIKEHSIFKILESGITLQNCYPEEGYFFTPEELNEYTQRVIKQALETAAINAETLLWQNNKDLDIVGNRANYIIEDLDIKKSITNTFEETFKLFKL